MKTTKRLLVALLAALLTLSLAACDKDSGNGNGKVNIPTTQTGSDDFQKNLHQAIIKSAGLPTFLETDTGYYVAYESLYYIEKETMKVTILCAKPDCDHTDPDICNALIGANYLLTGGEEIYYVANGNNPKEVKSVKYDGTERKSIQELKFTSSSLSSYDWGIYHRGYIYYISDDILYRVKLGGKKDSAEEIWSPENAGETQSDGGYAGSGYIEFNPNAIRYTLWADGDSLYFMANVQTTDGTYKDVLFQCDLTDMNVKQVWVTPGADEVGEWEETGVSVSQWYITGGYIYFYLSGGDMWRTELSSGKTEKLADTHEQTQYGSAVFSDDHMCLLNDMPVDDYVNKEFKLGGSRRSNGDTIFVYGLDGTFLTEVSLASLYDELGDIAYIDMLMCDATDVYFLATTMVNSTQYGWSTSGPNTIALCHANIETGAVEILYTLKNG